MPCAIPETILIFIELLLNKEFIISVTLVKFRYLLESLSYFKVNKHKELIIESRCAPIATAASIARDISNFIPSADPEQISKSIKRNNPSSSVARLGLVGNFAILLICSRVSTPEN